MGKQQEQEQEAVLAAIGTESPTQADIAYTVRSLGLTPRQVAHTVWCLREAGKIVNVATSRPARWKLAEPAPAAPPVTETEPAPEGAPPVTATSHKRVAVPQCIMGTTCTRHCTCGAKFNSDEEADAHVTDPNTTATATVAATDAPAMASTAAPEAPLAQAADSDRPKVIEPDDREHAMVGEQLRDCSCGAVFSGSGGLGLHLDVMTGLRKHETLATNPHACICGIRCADDKARALHVERANRLGTVADRQMREQEAEEAARKEEEAAAARRKLAEPCDLPGGRTYTPRALGDNSTDVAVLRKCRDEFAPILLWGPPGAGKTALVMAAFGADVLRVNGDGDTLVDDFVGSWQPGGTPGEYVWVDGPLTTALKDGRPLFVDDATLIPPKVLSALYPAMDGQGQIVITQHSVDGRPEIVKAAAGFYVIAGHNPGVHGAILTEALASRFLMHIQVPTDYELAAGMKISKKAITAARNLDTMKERGEVLWSPQLRELMGFQKIEKLLGERAAVANLVSLAPVEDREVVVKQLLSVFGYQPAPLTLGGQV